MRVSRLIGIVAVLAFVVSLVAQQPAAQGQRGQRGSQLTPEEREARARQNYEREVAMPRSIAALDSVWMEELTYLEIRDAMKAGKTSALIFAGGVEQNGPYLATGKHNYAVRVVGEAVARKLGNALIAPVLTVESGNPEDKYLEWGSTYITEETYRSILRDMATSLKSQGFKNIFMMGDSGSNTAGMRAISQELTEKWKGSPGVYHVPEYYNWTSHVRKFVTDNGIPEKINADGIHDEYGITATMMAYDPATVRFDQRVAANKATINGISIVPKDKSVEFGKKVVNFRADMAVTAITKILASRASNP